MLSGRDLDGTTLNPRLNHPRNIEMRVTPKIPVDIRVEKTQK